MSAQKHYFQKGLLTTAIPSSIEESVRNLAEETRLVEILAMTETDLVVDVEIVRSRREGPAGFVSFQGTATVYKSAAPCPAKVEGLINLDTGRGHLCFLPDDFQFESDEVESTVANDISELLCSLERKAWIQEITDCEL